ncbi:uncharacterized protein LOC125232176 [Leguminivora glycinivorella]|uniref:uncharacterized protein LOC125232176 n=1 Tax=Leguminivora glycinivorella TaxID=1035111 RepID=UPI00200D0331|nr:uncharacterized protein LOC125232176 [Leguminivora glycinivorella]
METKRIIECVRKREFLYNFKLQDYKNTSKKHEAWEQIATELDLTATECKAKWNRVRNAFAHAMSRRKAGEGMKNYVEWKYENEMAFLLPFMVNKNNRNSTATPVAEYLLVTNQSSDEDIVEESFNTNNTPRRKRHSMKETSPERSEKNDINLFFDSIAETVKKFPKLEQVKLKFNIMKMVNEIEMKTCLEYDGASTWKSSPSYNHNFSP